MQWLLRRARLTDADRLPRTGSHREPTTGSDTGAEDHESPTPAPQNVLHRAASLTPLRRLNQPPTQYPLILRSGHGSSPSGLGAVVAGAAWVSGTALSSAPGAHNSSPSVQVVAAPDRELLWVSGALPGAVHDTRAARIWRLAERIQTARLFGLADKGLCRSGPRSGVVSVQGPGQTLVEEGRQLRPRHTPRSWRAGHRPVEELARHPPGAVLPAPHPVTSSERYWSSNSAKQDEKGSPHPPGPSSSAC
ncbi:hypothetical protein ABH917_001106 [Thermobifida halotolerans]